MSEIKVAVQARFGTRAQLNTWRNAGGKFNQSEIGHITDENVFLLGQADGSAIEFVPATKWIPVDNYDFSTLESNVAAIKADAATLKSGQTTIKGYTDTLETVLGQVKNYVDTLESGQTTIKGYTDTLETVLNQVKGYTDTLESGQTTIKGYVDGIETQTNKLSGIESTLNTVNENTSQGSSPIKSIQRGYTHVEALLNVSISAVDMSKAVVLAGANSGYPASIKLNSGSQIQLTTAPSGAWVSWQVVEYN